MSTAFKPLHFAAAVLASAVAAAAGGSLPIVHARNEGNSQTTKQRNKRLIRYFDQAQIPLNKAVNAGTSFEDHESRVHEPLNRVARIYVVKPGLQASDSFNFGSRRDSAGSGASSGSSTTNSRAGGEQAQRKKSPSTQSEDQAIDDLLGENGSAAQSVHFVSFAGNSESEDRHEVRLSHRHGLIVGVYDGHAGSDCADFCSLNLGHFCRARMDHIASGMAHLNVDPRKVRELQMNNGSASTGLPDQIIDYALTHAFVDADLTWTLAHAITLGAPHGGSAPALAPAASAMKPAVVIAHTDEGNGDGDQPQLGETANRETVAMDESAARGIKSAIAPGPHGACGSGACAIVAVVGKDRTHIANAGDCRAVMGKVRTKVASKESLAEARVAAKQAKAEGAMARIAMYAKQLLGAGGGSGSSSSTSSPDSKSGKSSGRHGTSKAHAQDSDIAPDAPSGVPSGSSVGSRMNFHLVDFNALVPLAITRDHDLENPTEYARYGRLHPEEDRGKWRSRRVKGWMMQPSRSIGDMAYKSGLCLPHWEAALQIRLGNLRARGADRMNPFPWDPPYLTAIPEVYHFGHTNRVRVRGALDFGTAKSKAADSLQPPQRPTTEMIEETEFVILATDGLWEILSNEEAVQIVHAYLASVRQSAGPGKDIGRSGVMGLRSSPVLRKFVLGDQEGEHDSRAVGAGGEIERPPQAIDSVYDFHNRHHLLMEECERLRGWGYNAASVLLYHALACRGIGNSPDDRVASVVHLPSEIDDKRRNLHDDITIAVIVYKKSSAANRDSSLQRAVAATRRAQERLRLEMEKNPSLAASTRTVGPLRPFVVDVTCEENTRLTPLPYLSHCSHHVDLSQEMISDNAASPTVPAILSSANALDLGQFTMPAYGVFHNAWLYPGGSPQADAQARNRQLSFTSIEALLEHLGLLASSEKQQPDSDSDSGIALMEE
eukprot:Clim_evm5s230 gene=Clim_evmTU5s230